MTELPERIIASGPLSPRARFRVFASGNLTSREIDVMIQHLQIGRDVLFREEEERREHEDKIAALTRERYAAAHPPAE